MANEFNKINTNCVNTCDDVDQQLIEKLFPKCRPKNKSIDCNNDINQNFNGKRDDKQLLIDLDFINDNTMNESKEAKDMETDRTDNVSKDCVKSNLAAIGFKLDQLLLSPEEEFKPLNHNFINRPSLDNKEDEDDPISDKDLILRESRIEIAGGREIFSASKSRPNKKRVNHNLLSHHNMNNEERVSQSMTKHKRNNTTQTILNEKSISSTPEATTNASVNQLLQSPICDLLTDLSKSGEHKHKLSSGIVVYEDMTSKQDSEIIFDDIEEIEQKELKLSVKPITSESQSIINSDPSYNQCPKESPIGSNSFELEEAVPEGHDIISDKSEDSNSETNTPCNKSSMVDENKGIARVIGNVPIAQYDGSPRRYGPKPPGYPQRVTNSEDLSIGLANSNVDKSGLGDISCDELVKSILSIPMPYEDSPTNASNGSKSHSSDIPSVPTSELESDKNDVIMETTDPDMNIYQFSDLDYKLYRMNSVGNSYVGKRLATLSSANSEDDRSATMSPSKSVDNSMIAHENELILLHERVRQHIFNEIVSNDRSPVSAEAGPEVVGQSVEPNRNFTLSPDITDCDSNEIESELSLEGSLVSNNKIIAMPVLEDGLSSGVPSSDNELDEEANLDSPISLSYNKKQVCDRLEEELVSKLRLKLKRNDSLGDTQIGYNNSLHRSQTEYRNESTECCQKLSSQSIIKDSRIDQNGSHYGMESNNCDHQSHESIWVPRNESNQNKPVDSNHEELNCEQNIPRHHEEDCDTDQETDRLLGAQRSDDRGFYDDKEFKNILSKPKPSLVRLKSRQSLSNRVESSLENKNGSKRSNATREVFDDPSVLIEGVLFRARYLGSTQLVCEGQPTKATRMMQAEEAVSRIKAPEGDTQPSTDVDLFISTEKIMVLNTDLKEIMMDHSLRTISYIADIGDLLVLMARRRILNAMDDTNENSIKRIPKMICHVFESEEAQFIAQSIGQAFQVAYMEFLKANGIEDSSFVKEMDYQEVLNSQEIFGNELEMFAKKEKQKEVIVPKQKGEILGMVIVESGWGSMLPTVVIANMAQHGPSARCGQLNIGDQIIAINGVSLVGLPLSTCQNYIKNTKNQTVVKFTVVPCPPVVEVKIKRPDTKYQLGFSVQNGVICSLLRGGIAERGGVRVGHRIIEINGQSVVAVPHDRIVNLLATSVGEILMKTMPTSMFRLLTGQEMPTYM